MGRCLVFLAVLLLFLFVLSVSAHGGAHDDNDADSDTNSGSSEKPNLRSRSLILVKIWCLIIVFVGTFVGGISPYFLNWNEGFLVTGTQFAGGVFLGTAMMHFLSDSNETFHQLTDKEYPFAFMLSTVGYLLTMFADSVIYFVYAKQSANLSSNTSDLELQGNSAQDREERTHVEPHLSKAAAAGTTAKMVNVSSLGDSILLIFALCFHSVFEGIAIGVAETKADAWRALWTVCLHKIFAAIAMGIALLRMIPDRPLLSTVAYAFAFAISSPIGVGIGIVIDATTQGVVADWVYAISMGLACGVFVYVSINHLLSKNYNTNHHPKVSADQQPYYQFLAVLLGISVIAVVMIWD